jgi:hypothetical protein
VEVVVGVVLVVEVGMPVGAVAAAVVVRVGVAVGLPLGMLVGVGVPASGRRGAGGADGGLAEQARSEASLVSAQQWQLGDIRRNPPRLAMQWRNTVLHYAQEGVMEFAGT